MLLTLLAFAGRAAGQTEIPADGTDPQPDGTEVQTPSDDGPLIVGTSRETWRTVELIKLESALEFRYQSQHDKLRQSGQPDQTTDEKRLRGLFDLTGEVAFGHRNLVDLTGTVQFGLEEISLEDSLSGTNSDETDTVELWDLNALILGTSALPTSVFARRERSFLDRAFAGAIEETLTEEGIASSYQNSFANASFRYFHRETELSGDLGSVDSVVSQDSLNAQAGFVLSAHQRLETIYAFDRVDESQSGGYSDAYDKHDANVIHTWTFGEETRPHELRSNLRVFSQTGRQSQDTVRLDETLTLRHTDRFETRYGAALDTQEVRGARQTLSRLEASARHRLFESLTSSGGVGAQQFQTDGDFSSEELFANAQFDYTKEVPLGRLDGALGANYSTQSNSERGSTLSIIDESYTYNDGFTLILSRRNIVPGSVVIRPPSSTLPYIENSDYTVTYFVDHTEIRGLVGGAFIDGQVLLISYDVGPDPASDIDTLTMSYSLRYTLTEGPLKGVGFYSTYRTVGHEVRTADPTTFVLDDVNDFLIGTEYVRNGIDVSFEYNDHDSTFDPYQVRRMQALYVVPMGVGSSLSADASREIIDYVQQDDHVIFDRASVRTDYRLTDSLDLNLRLEYRREDSSNNGASEGFDQTIGFNWHKRQTTVYCNFRNSMLEGSTSDQTSQLLQFGVRRSF